MPVDRRKVLVLTGIKSEYDILYPVIKELEKRNHNPLLVVSGAHLSNHHNYTYKRIIEDGFRISEKIDNLISTDRVIQRGIGIGLLIQGLSRTVERLSPDFIFVTGDREESLAAAIVGNYMNVIVVHKGGGDPVYGNSDDPVRFAVSKLAHIHCCNAMEHAKNLKQIGEEDFRIFFTGHTIFKNIKDEKVISLSKLKEKLGIKSDNYVVLMKHPLSSEINDSEFQMETTMSALETFCEKTKYQIVYLPSNSDPGSFRMEQVTDKYKNKSWMLKLETLPRKLFINLMRNAKALIGNSSMGIIEAPFYKLPVINIGNRQKGRINAGNVQFVDYDVNEINEALKKAIFDRNYIDGLQEIRNPYGDDSAPGKIVDVIESVNLDDKKWFTKKKLC